MLFSKLLALVGATLTLANGDVPRNEPNGVHFPRQVNAKPLQDIVSSVSVRPDPTLIHSR